MNFLSATLTSSFSKATSPPSGRVTEGVLILEMHEASRDDLWTGDHGPRFPMQPHHHHHHPIPRQMLSLPENGISHIPDALPIHKDSTPGDLANDPPLVGSKFEDIAVLGQIDVLRINPYCRGETRMVVAMPVLAVDREEELRAGEVQHQLELLLTRVTRHVHGGQLLRDHLCPPPEELVDSPRNRSLVSRDHPGGEDHRVSGGDFNFFFLS